MSRRKKNHGVQEEDNEIDLTPMLDVVFIMLIFFIVTASFVKEVGLDINLPPESDAPPPTDAPPSIILKVDSRDEIWVDDRRVDVRAVGSLLQTKVAETPKAPVIIIANKEATSGTYVAIADAAKGVGKVATLKMVDYE